MVQIPHELELTSLWLTVRWYPLISLETSNSNYMYIYVYTWIHTYIYILQDYIPYTKGIQQLVGAHYGACSSQILDTHEHSITTCNIPYVQLVIIQYTATHHK